MRDLVITQNITVDGVVEATDDWFGRAGGDPEVDAALAAQRDASDGFLVGRETFVGMRDYWGSKTDDTTGVTAHLNSVAKYVASQTLDDPRWHNTEVLSGPLADDVTQIKNRPGGDIVCTGSIGLCHALISAGLVDEFRLFVHPFARGSGRRLFDATAPARLTLVESTRFPSGVMLVRYRTA
ncbi:dihydrofolate reductase family protein [Williamsia sp.]|uniref:dihydrofolate reductase family protein n=1 Tax=Williamsia sp. TaxID=1872085 RepID=UPI001A28C2D4|nr:dihydrofolate reductase family protein [Williamsia sp.]MBJ7288149.1 dihydrofolate reductase family protein [Williamsia sp.]